jgi:hypothetical protein
MDRPGPAESILPRVPTHQLPLDLHAGDTVGPGGVLVPVPAHTPQGQRGHGRVHQKQVGQLLLEGCEQGPLREAVMPARAIHVGWGTGRRGGGGGGGGKEHNGTGAESAREVGAMSPAAGHTRTCRSASARASPSSGTGRRPEAAAPRETAASRTNAACTCVGGGEGEGGGHPTPSKRVVVRGHACQGNTRMRGTRRVVQKSEAIVSRGGQGSQRRGVSSCTQTHNTHIHTHAHLHSQLGGA